MPIAQGKYVRYWSGNAAAYGVVTEVKATTYRIRVGGTDMVVEVPHGLVGLHPALVASGSGLDSATYKRVQVEDIWLYHATSCDLLPSITTAQGLSPRSRVNWGSLGGGCGPAPRRPPAARPRSPCRSRPTSTSCWRTRRRAPSPILSCWATWGSSSTPRGGTTTCSSTT